MKPEMRRQFTNVLSELGFEAHVTYPNWYYSSAHDYHLYIEYHGYEYIVVALNKVKSLQPRQRIDIDADLIENLKTYCQLQGFPVETILRLKRLRALIE